MKKLRSYLNGRLENEVENFVATLDGSVIEFKRPVLKREIKMSKNENMYTKQQILDLFQDLLIELKDLPDNLPPSYQRFQRTGFNESFNLVESYAETVRLEW